MNINVLFIICHNSFTTVFTNIVNSTACQVNRKATNLSTLAIEESHEIVLSVRILMKFRGKRLEKGRDSGTPNDLRADSRECEARCV